MNNYFKITERNSTIKQEILAGITTFFAMSYILAVNPLILSQTGMDAGAVLTATAISAIIACLIMGLYANYPVALAAGMGMNAFFTYTIVLQLGYTWQEGLFAIFVSGIIFIIISISGLREQIIKVIPKSLKYATSAGIGFFIAFIGLQSCGIIVANDSTLVALGDITNPQTLLAILGLLLMFFFYVRKNNYAIILAMVICTIVGIILQFMGIQTGLFLPQQAVSMPPSIQPVAFQLFSADNLALLTDLSFWVIVFSALFIDFFDTTGTLVAVGSEAGFINEEGEITDSRKALLADGVATTIGATLGTSSVTTYIESLSGIKSGGRTGLTTVTVAVCFFIALFFSPVLAIITTSITAPALIMVGTLMAVNKAKINYEEYADTAASFITILIMVTSYSISEGISAGFITYTFIKVAQGKYRDVHPIMYGLCLIFIIHYFL